MMKIGTITFATNQGLGLLAKDFYDHGIINSVFVVRHHCRANMNEEWYPGAPITCDLRGDRGRLAEYVKSLDVLVVFETPFLWDLVGIARNAGVSTVLIPMYECTPWPLPATFDQILCPSLLDLQFFPGARHIPVPVPDHLPWRQRTHARVYVHNAGHGGLKGRNGTKELLDAIRLVRSEARFIIRSQAPIMHPAVDSERVTMVFGTVPYEDLWKEGDVFVFPEKFNGLSLPLQEARAAGMLVMAGNRFPMNKWLPNESLIPVQDYVHDRIGGCIPFKSALYSPGSIAAKIDEWYNRDISGYSRSGWAWGQTMSWHRLGPIWRDAITNEGVVLT